MPFSDNRHQVSMPFYLTKKDRKRIRRQARQEREHEKQDKVGWGACVLTYRRDSTGQNLASFSCSQK